MNFYLSRVSSVNLQRLVVKVPHKLLQLINVLVIKVLSYASSNYNYMHMVLSPFGSIITIELKRQICGSKVLVYTQEMQRIQDSLLSWTFHSRLLPLVDWTIF